jgi:hypothetical protein
MVVMRTALLVVVMSAALVLPGRAAAVQVFTCSDGDGHRSYQQQPCDAGMRTESQRQFASEASPPVATDTSPRPARARAADSRPESRSRRGTNPRRERTLAFECSAAGRHWTQLTPCDAPPARTTHGSGRQATTRSTRPVQRELGRSEVCARVRDGTLRGSDDERAADSTYLRNRLRERGC